MTKEDQRAYDIVRTLFKNDYGDPFLMTPGQISLFRAIYEREVFTKEDLLLLDLLIRIQFDCYTQYGKSDVVSMAVLLRATTFPEKWIILGATKDKSGIIMSKVIKHIFENDYTLGKFQIDEDESLDFIRRNRSKDNLTFKVDSQNIGQIITLSADARRKSQDAGDILIGHGGQNLIIDDAALIPDPIYAKALRMLGGHRQNFMLKITNSFGRNHAYRSRNDPLFKKFVIDYKQGLLEGRLTDEFISEVRRNMDPVMFGILYECVYPPSDMVEDGGWMALLTPEQVAEAEKRSATIQSIGIKRMGVDISEGTNMNAFVQRTDNVASVKETTLEKDLMKTAERIVGMISEDRLSPEEVRIDAVAIGAGVFARVKQLGLQVVPFKGGESPTEKTLEQRTPGSPDYDPIEYYNLRAECYWKLRLWVTQGGALTPHKDWQQLSKIKYRTTSDKKIQIMSKEEMRARGDLMASESTDIPDGLSMTFFKRVIKFKANAVQSVPVKPFYPDIDGAGRAPGSADQAQQSEARWYHDLN